MMENISLKKYNTYRIECHTKELVVPEDINSLTIILDKFREKEVPYYILGGGSNVILPDDNYNGVIVKLDKIDDLHFLDNLVFVGSGTTLNTFIKKTIDRGLVSLAPLYGIPGSVGGAIVGNAGANGYEIFSNLEYILIYDEGNIEVIKKSNLSYGYRYSELKDNKKIVVLGALFELKKGNVTDAWKMIKANLEKRKDTQPLEYPSAGSVFKNPEGLSAGKLIDECGLKGYSIGGAKISEKHANFIINYDNATSSDIKKLIKYIQEEVKKQKGIELELEQVIVEW